MIDAKDDLTGLNHRRAFIGALRRQIGYANERQSNLALIVADVDDFSRINGAHGYDFGDQLLRHVALKLQQMARKHDYVARIGGDRFAVILPGVMNQGHVELAIGKLLRLLDLPFESGNTRVKVNLTVGSALCPLHASQADYLLRQAEKALVSARALGQRVQFPADTGGTDLLSEFWDIEIELKGAIERGEMHMHYQPKFDGARLLPVGAEALMRWNNRSRGAISPNVFIPIAERTGQIKTLTLWALNTALRQASEWQHELGSMSLAVNIPAELVTQHDLPELVHSALKLWGSEYVQLTLEITERSLVKDPKHSFKILTQLRELGVKISIDDFGTGYSCLAYFKDIPADELKIDQSFVFNLLSDNASADITWLIIDLAHRFGLNVVAEGVENVATLRVLQQHRCDVLQGFLFSAAMSNAEFSAWLARWGCGQPTFWSAH